jgi:hypothetical protein
MSIQELLEGRFSQSEPTKVRALAKQSAEGALTSFSGLFKPTSLSAGEQEALEELLHAHQPNETYDIAKDVEMLLRLTSEVKAIHNQASLLHGERIATAQRLLKQYKDGAFSAWLIATYGNRQTPYNFLLYYEFYHQLSSELRPLMETMPRQAVYTLASRAAGLEEKKAVIRAYTGQTKQEMLEIIRQKFPLASSDKRKGDAVQELLLSIQKLTASFNGKKSEMTAQERQEIALCLKKFLFFVERQIP